MGCDYYANEDGKFVLKIYDYETGNELDRIEIKHLEPNRKLSCDLIEGEER